MSNTDRILHETKLIREDIAAVKKEVLAIKAKLPTLGRMPIDVIEVNVDTQGTPMPTDTLPDFKAPSTSVSVILQTTNPRLTDGSRTPVTFSSWRTSDDVTLPLQEMPDDTVKIPDPNWVDPGDGTSAPLVEALDPIDNLPLLRHRVRALTPLSPLPGDAVSAIVTLSAPGMWDSARKIAYGDPALGHFSSEVSVEQEV